MVIEQTTTVFDLALMLNGSVNNIFDLMKLYNITEIEQDLTSLEIDENYNTNVTFVNKVFMNDIKIATLLTDNTIIELGEFNDDYSSSFTI